MPERYIAIAAEGGGHISATGESRMAQRRESEFTRADIYIRRGALQCDVTSAFVTSGHRVYCIYRGAI